MKTHHVDDATLTYIAMLEAELAVAKQHIRTDNSAVISALQEELARIKEAARAVVERWHTPLWKDVPATAEYINALERAIREGK